jgi:hypothetical protein
LVARTNPLFDAWGVIYDAAKRLPNEQLKLGFVAALAELGITSAIAPASFRRRVYTGSLAIRRRSTAPISIRFPAGVSTCNMKTAKCI